MKHQNIAPPQTGYSGLPVGVGQVGQMIERVAQSDVRYLCFEGGGGKGIIFLGALKALEQRRVLRFEQHRLARNEQIDGIAGSSAGALTAVLLSCGYRPAFLERLLLGGYDFNLFFDQPGHPARIPTPFGCHPLGHGEALTRIFGPVKGRILREMLGWAARGGQPNDGLRTKLLSRRLLPYMFNLVRHYGMFSGCAAQNLFNTLIAQQAARITGQGNPNRYLNMTFAQHYRIFRVRLVLTGSNFSTGHTTFFSADTSPNFPVAAAARISMSLPLIMKPMIIPQSVARQLTVRSSHPRNLSADELTGVWVDGGYLNNLPRTAFAHIPDGLRRTLSFSLNEFGAGPTRINSFVDFLSAYAMFGLVGTGESQGSRTTGAREDTVQLVAGDARFKIGTTDFSFTPAQIPHVRRLITDAERDTKRYFDGT